MGVNTEAGRSYSTVGRGTANRLSSHAAIPLDTQMLASTSRASRRSYHRASRTAGFHRPKRCRSTVNPRLCQSTTKRTFLRWSENHDTASVGKAGGFCVSTRSG